MKQAGLSALVLGVGIFTAAPSWATATSPIEATCTWHSIKGEHMKQPCRIVGNSSAGSGTSYIITWEDGVQTVISSRGTGFVNLQTGKPVKLQGEFVRERMGFPKRLQIEGLGEITIAPHN